MPLLLRLLLVCCFAFSACAKEARPLTLAFAEVDEDSNSTAPEFSRHRENSGPPVRLHEPVPFAVADAYLTSDALGWPAVGFQLTEADSERFRAWTRERVERTMAILVDGKVYQVATIKEALPGGGMISGGDGFTKEQAEALIVGLKAGAKK